MSYITTRRAKFLGINGPVNLPYGTKLDQQGRFVYYDGKALCTTNSNSARLYMAPDYDGYGLERGALITTIKATLGRKDADHQKRWDKIWGALMCKRYRNPEHQDFWVWNQAFYEAPLCDLQSIARLIGININ